MRHPIPRDDSLRIRQCGSGTSPQAIVHEDQDDISQEPLAFAVEPLMRIDLAIDANPKASCLTGSTSRSEILGLLRRFLVGTRRFRMNTLEASDLPIKESHRDTRLPPANRHAT